jgi:hypothetical protein
LKRLYRDQLALSERHLDSLLDNTTSALDLLATLSESFKSVESQTTAFQGQCEDLLTEQKRLRNLADEVGTELQYYAYLEPLTRRLNAPGAGRLIRSDDFLDMLLNLNTCIDFMDQHVSGLLFDRLGYPACPNCKIQDTDYNSQITVIRVSTRLDIHLFLKDHSTSYKWRFHQLFER